MIECMILGDSIAVGIAQYEPKCKSYSEVGISSWGWYQKFTQYNLTAKTVVISLGSNDTALGSIQSLSRIRSKIDAEKVIWILPAIHPEIQRKITAIANRNNDLVVKIPEVSLDKVHPTPSGYKTLAGHIK